MGTIAGNWLAEEQKLTILESIEQASTMGISRTRSCAMWMINRRRVVRWFARRQQRAELANGKPGPKEPGHRLLPQERTAVLRMATQPAYGDLSHRILAVTAWDLGLFFVSFSSVYRILRLAGLMGIRGHHRHHNGRSLPPVRKQISGPNQRWCWDISYLPTYERGLFLYLYLLLDEFSRKALNWLVSWHQRAEEAKELLEGGLLSENILAIAEHRRPEIFNDRGRQMKARSIKTVFELHGMPQVFARPRTPNDNPFVESAFGTAKTAPGYPGRRPALRVRIRADVLSEHRSSNISGNSERLRLRNEHQSSSIPGLTTHQTNTGHPTSWGIAADTASLMPGVL